MLATILLALAILPIVGIFSQGHKMTQKDMRRIEAIHFAESTMNKLLKLPFAQVPVGLKNANLVAASGTVSSWKCYWNWEFCICDKLKRDQFPRFILILSS